MNDNQQTKNRGFNGSKLFISYIKPFRKIKRMKKPFKITFLYIPNFKKKGLKNIFLNIIINDVLY
jgi:hypothetical protein